MLSNDHNCPLYCAIELFTTAPILPIVAVVTFTRLPLYTSHEPDTMARLRDNREKIAKSSNHVPSKKVDSLRLVVKELQERLNIHHRLLDKIQVKFSVVGHFLLIKHIKKKFKADLDEMLKVVKEFLERMKIVQATPDDCQVEVRKGIVDRSE